MVREQFSETEGIYRPRNHEPVQNSVLSSVVFYTTTGKHDRLVNEFPVLNEDGPTAYAKKDGQKFYVKSNGGQLADPRGLYENDLYKRVGDTPVWTWKRVNPRTFDFYVAYLKSANKSHYHNASREMFNG